MLDVFLTIFYELFLIKLRDYDVESLLSNFSVVSDSFFQVDCELDEVEIHDDDVLSDLGQDVAEICDLSEAYALRRWFIEVYRNYVVVLILLAVAKFNQSKSICV